MKLALSTLLFPRKTVEEAVKQAADIGFNSVEILYEIPHFIPKIDYEKLEGLRDLLKSLGMTSTLHASFWDLNPMSQHPAIRETAILQTKDSIHACDILGSELVTIHPGRCIYHMMDDMFAQAKNWYREYMLECWAYARDLGVKLAVESGMAPTDYPNTSDQMAELTGYFENLGVTIDVAHMYIRATAAGDRDPEGEIVRALFELGKRVYNVHFHDNNGIIDEHLVPGKGSMDWERVLEAIKEVKYDGSLVLELWKPENSLETGKKGFAVMKDKL